MSIHGLSKNYVFWDNFNSSMINFGTMGLKNMSKRRLQSDEFPIGLGTQILALKSHTPYAYLNDTQSS